MSGYDSWKLATPPEYDELTPPEYDEQADWEMAVPKCGRCREVPSMGLSCFCDKCASEFALECASELAKETP